ncbi:unnamed protein product [Nippostrongylus brasiliensis]|uniref:ABC transmembrane type-1 domain-containing protein n=1 Tax=Nippostrongylus brasiliensis TaxID=27835 RepID=A0A0N4XF40_NIPBR|nr:unnamed protein product [Nippostrongylus brasiliensis]
MNVLFADVLSDWLTITRISAFVVSLTAFNRYVIGAVAAVETRNWLSLSLYNVILRLDEELDKRIDLENVKAAPLAAIWIQG